MVTPHVGGIVAAGIWPAWQPEQLPPQFGNNIIDTLIKLGSEALSFALSAKELLRPQLVELAEEKTSVY